MILSIIPSHGSGSVENKKPDLSEKRFSFSSPFSQIAKNKAANDSSNDNLMQKQIGIHVAGPDILLPLINRPKEVKMLLQETSIYQQLQKVHLPYSTEWDIVQSLLFEQEREQISDREWLRELHSIIFARSPRLWCQFNECIGARDAHFSTDSFDEGIESTLESEDVCASDSFEDVQIPTFEFLKQLPSTYRKPVDQIDAIAIADCHNENYTTSVDEMTNSLKEQEVRHISDQSKESFLGLRIRLRSQSESNDASLTGNISPLSIGASADTGLGLRNASSTTRSSTLPFRKQRRLSQLFLSELTTSSPIQIPQKPLHGRNRSASSKGQSEMFDNDGPSHQWYRQYRQRDLDYGKTEPVSLLLNRNPTWQPFAPPVEVNHKQPTSKNEKRKSLNLDGLLPDGRTRHPSAGSGEMKASLATFRKENQNAETSSGSSSPNSVGLSPSMQVEVDTSGHCLRWPLNDVLPISPITDASDRSMPQTPGEVHTSLSPITAFTPLESTTKHSIENLAYSESAFGSFSDPLSSVLRPLKQVPSPAVSKQAPSTVIYPVPPCAGVSRADELIRHLNRIQENVYENEEDKKAALEAFSILQATIGSEGIVQLNNLIQTAGERDRTTDEELLRAIASNCFGLVDMDLAIENGGKILCGSSGFDKHKRIKAEQQMKKQPWYIYQHNLSTQPNYADDQIEQTDQDHEARVQTFYENVDAYAKRFLAFDGLLSNIWNVDCTIMHTVRQRCGPVGQCDFKPQNTRRADKYMTKATY